MSNIFKPLILPNQQTLPNRIAKASMEENMADEGQIPGEALINLYRRWAEGGAGLILTGNHRQCPDRTRRDDGRWRCLSGARYTRTRQ